MIWTAQDDDALRQACESTPPRKKAYDWLGDVAVGLRASAPKNCGDVTIAAVETRIRRLGLTIRKDKGAV